MDAVAMAARAEDATSSPRVVQGSDGHTCGVQGCRWHTEGSAMTRRV